MGNDFDVLYTVSIFQYIRKYGFNFLGVGMCVSGNRKYGLRTWTCISKVIVKEFKIYFFYTYIHTYIPTYMKSYTSLYPSPDKDYTLFNEASSDASSSSISSISSLGGLGDNHDLKKYDDYIKTINNETQQKCEINQKSVEINLNRNMSVDYKKGNAYKPCVVGVKKDSGKQGCFSCFTWCRCK